MVKIGNVLSLITEALHNEGDMQNNLEAYRAIQETLNPQHAKNLESVDF